MSRVRKTLLAEFCFLALAAPLLALGVSFNPVPTADLYFTPFLLFRPICGWSGRFLAFFNAHLGPIQGAVHPLRGLVVRTQSFLQIIRALTAFLVSGFELGLQLPKTLCFLANRVLGYLKE